MKRTQIATHQCWRGGQRRDHCAEAIKFALNGKTYAASGLVHTLVDLL
ncbi:hypothetical protein [Stutzerimonas stutzeri]|nr:hypothetical protein [Stutzerimonas stutzeri]